MGVIVQYCEVKEIEGLDQMIQNACLSATKSFVKRYKGKGNIFEDTLQDAYVIALSKRGKQEAKTEIEFYYKVLYGLIDLHRHRVHSSYGLKSGKQRPEFIEISSESIDHHIMIKDFSYRKWISDKAEPVLNVVYKGKYKRISENELLETIQSCFLRLNPSHREIIKLMFQGVDSKEIARRTQYTWRAVQAVLCRFRKRVKTDLFKN